MENNLKESSIGQTIYEQLQEIQNKIADKTLSPGYIYENLGYRQEILLEHETEDDILYDVRDTQTNEIVRINRNTILLATNHNIGHPISLSRLLSALGEGYTYYVALEKIYDGDSGYIPRKLLNDYGSDAMINDQSPETIKAIWEIVCK